MAKEPLIFICNVPNATPAIYDSRFDETKTDKAHGGKVKRQHRFVKRDDKLAYVGFESRGQFTPGNQTTEEQNEEDRQMLLKRLDAMGVDVTGNEPLYQLGKTYNYYDPRLAHVRRKHGPEIKALPVIGLKKGAANEESSAGVGDSDEITTIKARLKELNVDFHQRLGLKNLKHLLAEAEERVKKEAEEAEAEAKKGSGR